MRARGGHGVSMNGWRIIRDHHGVTVVDLIISVAIIGLLATMALPNLQPRLTKYRLYGAARQVMGDLMAARMKAVSQHRPYKVFFSESQTSTICDDANDDGIAGSGMGRDVLVAFDEADLLAGPYLPRMGERS
jgi:Tfp pilus assembly protein FimT